MEDNIINLDDYREDNPLIPETLELPIDEAMIEMLNNIAENVAYLDKKIHSLEKKINKLLNHTLNKTSI